MPGWHLADAELLAAENKYTFYKPNRELLARVARGEVVKLIFRFESDDPETPSAERMRVLVDEAIDGVNFKGRLDNEPRYITDLKADDPVEFEARHVISTERDDGDNIVERFIKKCFVTKRVLGEGYQVGYLYREESEREDDSGWRITSNTGTDDSMDGAANVGAASIGSNRPDAAVRGRLVSGG